MNDNQNFWFFGLVFGFKPKKNWFLVLGLVFGFGFWVEYQKQNQMFGFFWVQVSEAIHRIQIVSFVLMYYLCLDTIHLYPKF